MPPPSDDTTTVENTDFNEDQTQILNGTERLKYFVEHAQPVNKPLSQRRISWISILRKLKL